MSQKPLKKIKGNIINFNQQITNTKHQITNKFQIPISNNRNSVKGHVGPTKQVWNLEFWSLLFVCYLGFGIWCFHSVLEPHTILEIMQVIHETQRWQPLPQSGTRKHSVALSCRDRGPFLGAHGLQMWVKQSTSPSIPQKWWVKNNRFLQHGAIWARFGP